MSFLKIQVINPPEELKSFPLTQHIYLQPSEEVETSLIENNIVLIRIQKDGGVLRASDIYNTNIGHIKESYSTIPMRVRQEKGKLICDPVEPLSPGSDYILFLDKNVSKEFIELKKTASKGPSTLELENIYLDTDENVFNKYKLKVISSPSITSTTNIIKFQLYVNDAPHKVFTINAKSSKNKIEFNGLVLVVPDKAFALDEEFETVVKSRRQSLESNLVINIKTSISADVRVVENVEPSHAINYKDVIDYYETLEEVPPSDVGWGLLDTSKPSWEKQEFTIQYLDDNSFILHLNKLTTDVLDLDKIEFRQLPAYNRNDLKTIKKYFPLVNYKLTPEILDEKSVLFIAEEVI